MNGKKIQCYSWGKGDKTVVVIHGWAGRATQFRRFVRPLNAAGYRVIGFDGPAHGNSDGKRTTIVEFEEALHKIYEITGEPEAIIAHSFGGGVALFSAMKGLPIKKLINIASPTIGNEIINTYVDAVRASKGTAAFFKRHIIKTYGKTFDEFTSLYFICHLPKPINLLLVHDQNDKEVVIKHAEELQSIYPSAKLLRTKGLGHTRILKDDSVIAQCVTFIREGSLPSTSP